jgi:hypothetical protein
MIRIVGHDYTDGNPGGRKTMKSSPDQSDIGTHHQ